MPDDGPPSESNAKAFSALRELFENDQISGSQAAELRAVYQRMLIELNRMKQSEKDLITQAKLFKIELEEQEKQLILDSDSDSEQETSTPIVQSVQEPVSETPKDGEPAKDPSTRSSSEAKTERGISACNKQDRKKKLNEVQQLRNQLMQKLNSLAILEEKSSEDHYAIEVLTEHKRLLNLEKDRQPDEKMIAKQIEDINDTIRLDNRGFNTVSKNLNSTKESIAELEAQLIIQKKMLEQALENQDQVTAEMVANTNVDGMHPAELIRQIGKTAKSKELLEKESKEQNGNVEQFREHLKEKVGNHDSIFDELESLKKTYKESEARNDSKEKERAVYQKNLSREKLREQELVQAKEDLEINARSYDQEKASVHDGISKRKREYEKEARSLKKKQMQVTWIKEQSETNQNLLEMAKVELENFPKNERIEKESTDLLSEVDALKRKKMNEDNSTKEAKQAWESLIETTNKLNKEQEQERAICYEQGRMLHLKSDEREQKAREKQRAVNRLKQVEKELAAKQHELVDSQKRARELQIQQENSAKTYEQIKNEKNKYVNSIQSASQKREEIKHKLRNSANEIEVLQARLLVADRELTRKKKLNVSAETKISQEESKLNRARHVQEQINEDLGQVRITTLKLMNQKQIMEEEMIKLRKKYDQYVNSRNQRGIQLIEREEEVCVFYEKLNVQDNVIKKGDIKLQELEDEITFLKNQVTEEKRQIDILRKYRPELKELKNELIELQIELARNQDHTIELEQKLESPEKCASRIRHLEGEDLMPNELEEKLAQLELRLAQKEEQSLEKSLIYEQVDRLFGNAQEKHTNSDDDKRTLSEQCAEAKARLDEMNRKTLAMISEISMEKANSQVLQDKVNELTTLTSLCNERFTQGKPPTDEMLDEWKRYLRNQQMKQEQKLKEHQQYIELQKHILPNGGGITTAEPRPNAYLVQDADLTVNSGHHAAQNFPGDGSGSSNFAVSQRNLPVPKPYGNMAPFKPQPAGATMRHIKKPKAKPLEI